MRFSSNIIRQEVLMILAKKTFYIETIIFPLTMSLIMVLASSNRSSAALLNFIILLSIYGVLQNALSGSARSIEKEKYQDTLSLHFLSNISLHEIVFNKLLANILIGVFNLIILVALFMVVFPLSIYRFDLLIIGFVLMLMTSLTFSLCLSSIFFKMRSPYAASSILIRLILLITGILIPFDLFPRSLLFIVSFTGVPQVFNLILYGLSGGQLLDAVYMIMLPMVLVGQLAFGIYRFSTAEFNYLKTGGI